MSNIGAIWPSVGTPGPSSVVAVPQPAAGSVFSFTFTGSGLLVAIQCTLTTSATAGNRQFAIAVRDANNQEAFATQYTPALGPSLAAIFQFGAGLPYTTPIQTLNLGPLAPDLEIGPGWNLFVGSNIVAGDQFSAITVTTTPI